jgi:thiamine pyrophosphokinase
MDSQGFLIIANGEWPPESIWLPLTAQSKCVIACDGAAAQCFENDVKMDVVIGDMDSLSEHDERRLRDDDNVAFVRQTSQEENDLVKAMKWSIKQGAESIEVFGIEGGDFDHQFAAILSLCEVPFSTRIHTSQSIIQRVGKLPLTLHSIEKNSSFSLFAVGPVEGVNLTGAEWPLSNQTLSPGTRGIHNKSTGEKLHLECLSGELLLFLDR